MTQTGMEFLCMQERNALALQGELYALAYSSLKQGGGLAELAIRRRASPSP